MFLIKNLGVYATVFKSVCKSARVMVVMMYPSGESLVMQITRNALTCGSTASECGEFLMKKFNELLVDDSIHAAKSDFVKQVSWNFLLILATSQNDKIIDAAKLINGSNMSQYLSNIITLILTPELAVQYYREYGLIMPIFAKNDEFLNRAATIFFSSPRHIILDCFPGDLIVEYFKRFPQSRLTGDIPSEQLKELYHNGHLEKHPSIIAYMYMDGQIDMLGNVEYASAHALESLERFANEMYLDKHIELSKRICVDSESVIYCDMISRKMFGECILTTHDKFKVTADAMCSYVNRFAFGKICKIKPMASKPTHAKPYTQIDYRIYTRLWQEPDPKHIKQFTHVPPSVYNSLYKQMAGQFCKEPFGASDLYKKARSDGMFGNIIC